MSETETAQTTRYAVDARGSRVTIRGSASGLLSAVGHDPIIAAREVTGEIRFTPDRPDSAALRLTIPASSLAVQNDVSDKDRREMEETMKNDVLEVARYPEIVYDASQARVEKVSDGRYRVELNGELRLHGATRQERVSAQVFVMGDTLRAQGEVPLRQTDYGIKPVSAFGGTLKVKDDLKISFDLLARKAP